MKPASFITTILVLTALLAPFSSRTLSSAAAAGPRCYVDANVGGGANDGTSWGNAYTSLQAALGDLGCTEIWVAAGTYTPTTNLTNRLFSFVLRSGVAIHGGFAGGESSLWPRDFVTHETILSGDLNGDDLTGGDNSENSYNVVKGGTADPTAVLDGFTIRGGNANGTGGYNNAGAGVYNANEVPDFNCGPTLDNVTITGNSAATGAGMFNYDCDPNLSHFKIDHNQTSGAGAGMRNYKSHPTLHSGTIAYNTAAREGGGMSVTNDSSISISSVYFDHNSAQNGGGIYLDGGSNSSLDVVGFNANQATVFGGGMYISGTNPTLDHLTVSANTAGGGAGIAIIQASPQLTNSSFISNTSSGNGGGLAIYDASSQPVLNSDTFVSNSAGSGGGILNSSGTLLLMDGAFSGNTATGSGGGILNDSGVLNLERVDFVANTAGSGGGINTYSGTVDLADVAFRQNQAGGGAGLLNSGSALSLSRALFTGNGNSSTTFGGGIYNDISSSGSADLTNVTLSGNTAQMGGALYNNGPLRLTNATFDANTGSTNGGGIFTQTAMTIDDTILWGDAAPIYNNGTDAVTIHDSMVQGGLTCPSTGFICSNISSDFPYLDPLQNNGGYTETMAITNGNSYAIDHGNNATCAGTDQRGVLRPQDGNLDGDPICDIGAYELQLTWYLYLPLLNK